MTPTQVLAHLQRLFPDRLVLYAGDLAQVLGKNRKAVTHLLSQDKLPFKVKCLGQERCVDIYQVAEWLASDADSTEAVSVPAPALPLTTSSANAAVLASISPAKRPTTTSDTPESVPLSVSVADYGLMGHRILEMRHDYQKRMHVIDRVNDEELFRQELLTLVCMSPSLPHDAFVLVWTQTDWACRGGTLEVKVSVAWGERSACKALHGLFVEDYRAKIEVSDILVRHDGKDVFCATRNREDWDVLVDVLPSSWLTLHLTRLR